MLRLLFALFLCFSFQPLGAQTPFTVSGEIKGLAPSAKIYINFVNGEGREIDSADVNNGKFKIRGEAILPTTAQLRLKHSDAPVNPDPKLRKPLDILTIYIDEHEVVIESKDSLKNANFTNSEINLKFVELDSSLKNIRMRTTALNEKKFSDVPISNEALEAEKKNIEKDRVALLLDFAKTNSNSYIGLQAFSYAIAELFEPADVLPVFNLFPNKLKESILGGQIMARIDRAQKTAIGTITDFQQKNQFGKNVKLSDFRGSYVLVDFWASWCLPCREENPNIVKAYEQFKGEKFHIIGVSLDREDAKKQWLEAIKEDKLTWTQLSDLQFWNNAVAKKYEFDSIPFNFLVDPEGKIIAKQLTGVSLMEKLSEIFPSNK